MTTQVAVRFKFAQDGASRGSSDVGHIGEILVVYVDFDLPWLSAD